MQRFYILAAIFTLITSNALATNSGNFAQLIASADDSTNVAQNSKVKFKFGGRIDLAVFGDSYESRSMNRGLYYFYPLAPALNSIDQDVHNEGNLGFGIAGSRLNATVTAPNILGATARVYVEADFLGSTDTYFGNLRLRHAFFELNWKKTQLLFGQTDHLSIPVEAQPNTVSFGGGAPILPLSRVPQIRITQNLAPTVKLSLAASMASSGQGTMQSAALTPEVQAKLTIGRTTTSIFGIQGSYRSIRPRRIAADSIKTYTRLGCWSISAFGLHTFGRGHTIKLFAMWGQDLSPFTMMGGYAPILSEINQIDYGYAPISTLAASIDIETRRMKGWQAGIFGGLQKNLGTTEEIDLSKASISEPGIDVFFRIAPRVYYHYKGLSFGLEYMYSNASWARKMDNNYRPVSTYNNTVDHRITFLARFTF